jgi:hypothetical protein
VTDEIKVAVKDPEKKPSIMIATPMYGGMCTGHYVSGLLAAVSKLRDMGVKVYWAQMMNESLITRARNDLANTFLERGHDYLMSPLIGTLLAVSTPRRKWTGRG